MHSVLILDEIRLEATGKSILIGVYDDGIIVPMFPVAVPKLTVRVHFTLLEAAETFTLRITGDGGSVFGEPNHQPAVAAYTPFRQLHDG